jgi:hypothetical protein
MPNHRERTPSKSLEPPTRVLSGAELRDQLREAALAHGSVDDALTRPRGHAASHESEAVTRWVPRARSPAVPSEAATRAAGPGSDEPATTLAKRTFSAQELTMAALDAVELRAAALPRLGSGRAPAPLAAAAVSSLEAVPSAPQGVAPAPGASRRAVDSRRKWLAFALTVAVAAAILASSSQRSARPGMPPRSVVAPHVAAAPPVAARAGAPHGAAPRASASGSPRRALDLLLAGQRDLALDAYRVLAHERPQQLAYSHMVQLLEREARPCAESGSCP